MNIKLVSSPAAVGGLRCCDPFTIDLINAENGEPLRERDWRFYLFCYPPYECPHQKYWARPIFVEPSEQGPHRVADDLPIKVIIHRVVHCASCPLTLAVVFNTGNWKWNSLYCGLSVVARES